jgi:purine-binding chemotaxis protein CheW
MIDSTKTSDPNRHESQEGGNEFVTFLVADQLFGIPVLTVQEVLGPQRITRIPLAPAEVAGSLNLRGRIVTAIDIRHRLGMPARPADTEPMSVVVESRGDLYSLAVDAVGEVLRFETEAYEQNPGTLSPALREVSAGIYRLDGQLLIVLDVERLLTTERAEAA